MRAKNEREQERQERQAKKKVNLPRRIQPKRNAAVDAAAAVFAAAVISDQDSSDSDLDSRGSAASYDPGPELYYNVDDSDFYEGLVEEDKETYRKIIRRKKMFLSKARKTTVPILQRNELHDRASQQCEIVRVQQQERGRGQVVIAEVLEILLFLHQMQQLIHMLMNLGPLLRVLI